VIEYEITGSESPNTLDWPDVGVIVIARPPTVELSDAVEFAYALEAVGVNSTDNVAAPRSTGTQSQTAVVLAAATDSHPAIELPPNLKLTVPARDVVAVMRFVVLY
jgi:hypothetical protein